MVMQRVNAMTMTAAKHTMAMKMNSMRNTAIVVTKSFWSRMRNCGMYFQ